MGCSLPAAARFQLPIRWAGLCHDTFSARHARLHNDTNVLALGARVIGPGLAKDIMVAWLDAPFEDGRHARRVEKIRQIEEREPGPSG